jgi:glyoxylase-like metal-dependent hydrolase (beta-lactamase superfamily II)
MDSNQDDRRGSVRFSSAGILLAAAAATIATPAVGQTTPYDAINASAAQSPVTVKTLRGSVSLLQGSGGNIGVLAGPEGFLLVDAGIAVSEQKILAALRQLGTGAVRYAITTHWHWDHADGNSWLRRSGATVVAHEQAVRRLRQTIRVVEWQHTFTPVSAESLPNRIIRASETIRFSGEQVRVGTYSGPGHTDGDLSVYFVKADVLQVGDTFWNGQYPFLDYVGGGGIGSAIRAAEQNIRTAGRDTIVIPGHGPVGTRRDLIAFRDMLVTVRQRVAALKARGLSLEEAVAARPTAEFDEAWGKSIISGELFTALVYQGV